ncbi:hypothetical protein NA57DRAFT_52839 [Rhizodiscina lignyota]|uniref:HTH La-type RNA-binding domain-containing protein n=1 Tax=Rhizodiscina lignyota TaxID=1504668 RepID=A0A9P4IQ28_9PEZI|nr:hypothetical protein NA57DRAFT_52839 [Rhizodiscina lignyota]
MAAMSKVERTAGETPSMATAEQDPQEHPEADEIRQFYFSDENLATDSYLRMHMNGNANDTISVKHVMSFSKMKRFKPLAAVVAALKKSPFLEITPDKRIRRKIPYHWPDGDIDYVALPNVEKQFGGQQKAKLPPNIVTGPQRDPNKPEMTKGMLKPTGFEEYYTDPPVTPAEYAEERQIYDPDEPFHARIQVAIHRYTGRRKFHQSNMNIFGAFLKYGGIEAVVNQFAGLSKNDLEGMSALEISEVKSKYQVGDDKDPSERKWVVDFEGVVKGFLSSFLPTVVPPNEYLLTTRILANFYNYLLIHDVCSPTAERDLIASIQAAKAVCNLAAEELPNVFAAGLHLPGDFNVACSVLTGGYHEGLYVKSTAAWMQDVTENVYGDEVWGSKEGGSGMSDDKAKALLALALTAHGSEELFKPMAVLRQSLSEQLVVAEEKTLGLEVTKIEFGDHRAEEVYLDPKIKEDIEAKMLGRMWCKKWEVPDFQTWDVPKAQKDSATTTKKDEFPDYEFWVEDHILKSVFLGMKMEATIRRLALKDKDGPSLWNIDTVSRTYCSFFTYLPNELVPKPIKPVTWKTEEDEDEEVGEPSKSDTD